MFEKKKEQEGVVVGVEEEEEEEEESRWEDAASAPQQQRDERLAEERTRHGTRRHPALIERTARGAPHVFRCVNVSCLSKPCVTFCLTAQCRRRRRCRVTCCYGER